MYEVHLMFEGRVLALQITPKLRKGEIDYPIATLESSILEKSISFTLEAAEISTPSEDRSAAIQDAETSMTENDTLNALKSSTSENPGFSTSETAEARTALENSFCAIQETKSRMVEIDTLLTTLKPSISKEPTDSTMDDVEIGSTFENSSPITVDVQLIYIFSDSIYLTLIGYQPSTVCLLNRNGYVARKQDPFTLKLPPQAPRDTIAI
jgi:hypothetical protein